MENILHLLGYLKKFKIFKQNEVTKWFMLVGQDAPIKVLKNTFLLLNGRGPVWLR